MPIGPAILVTTSLLLAGTTPRPWSTGDDRVYVPPGERVPASAGDGMPSGASLIYLNRYGADLARGRDDSRAEPNRSSLLKGERDRATIPEFEGTERDWAEIVACVKRNFQPFNVELTEEDPGPRQHVEAIVGGSPDLIEREADVLGLAPFNCQPIRNAVVLIFSAQARSSLPAGRTVNEYLCEVTSHEIGHAFGLDHSMHASDLMSYLDFPTPKVFQFYDETCGEFSPRPCGDHRQCARTQNSAALLTSRIGQRGARAPRVTGGCQTSAPAWPLALALVPLLVHGSHRSARRRRTLELRCRS